jgi:hypothetical protein
MSTPPSAAAILSWVLFAGAAGVQPALAQSSAATNLSGIWVRTDEAGSGTFGGTLERLPTAELKPAAKAAVEQEQARRKEEEAKLMKAVNGVYRTPARCSTPSITFMMQHSGGIDIVQDKDEILIIAEEPTTQHIYMDGRAHPSAANWRPNGTGHSIGHWENGTLVVDTVGMVAGGGIPGGGRKRPETKLTERFRLRDPTHLVVTFTWEDDELYVRPHTYEFTYEKQPADSYSFESWCDVTDPLQGQSIVVPPK